MLIHLLVLVFPLRAPVVIWSKGFNDSLLLAHWRYSKLGATIFQNKAINCRLMTLLFIIIIFFFRRNRAAGVASLVERTRMCSTTRAYSVNLVGHQTTARTTAPSCQPKLSLGWAPGLWYRSVSRLSVSWAQYSLSPSSFGELLQLRLKLFQPLIL